MNFIEAIELMKSNSVKMKRTEWPEIKDGIRNYIKFDYDDLRDSDGYRPYLLYKDIIANDWEVYKEKENLVSFEEALEGFNKGRPIRRAENDLYLQSIYDKLSIEDMRAKDWIVEWEEQNQHWYDNCG